MATRTKQKAFLLVIAGVAAILGVAVHSRSAGGSTPALSAARVAAVSYARIAAAPPAPPPLASNSRVRTMAKLAGVDPTALRQVQPADQPLGALLAGRSTKGKLCVAEANEEVAGGFDCDLFRHGPLHLIAGSRGTPSHVTWSGFVGVADASVRRLVVRTAGGSTREVPIGAAGGFSYGGRDATSFPVEVDAYGADGGVVLSVALPATAPPALG